MKVVGVEVMLCDRDIEVILYVANQGSGGYNTSVGSDAMIINEDCNNDYANVSPSTVNRVQDGNVVNAT